MTPPQHVQEQHACLQWETDAQMETVVEDLSNEISAIVFENSLFYAAGGNGEE